MFEWWMELILAAVIFIAGFVTNYFMIRNNPKYLNVDKMIKDEIKKKREEVIKSVQEKVAGIK